MGASDDGLLLQIRNLWDRREVLFTSASYDVSGSMYEKNEKELRRLENLFTERFPETGDFTEISFERVSEAMPDDSAVIEYFCSSDYTGIRGLDAEEQKKHMIFDVYVMEKKAGCVHLTRNTIPEAYRYIELAERFLDAVQKQSDGTLGAREEYAFGEWREELYRALIRPVEAEVSGIERLYIAPDALMVNFPFGILRDQQGKYLCDKYHIIMIECARDFLFGGGDGATGEGSVIVGNPAFSIGRGSDGDDSNGGRFGTLEMPDIYDLPASEYEIRRVSEHLHSGYYSGREASKKRVLSASGKRVIHIATHGYYDFAGVHDMLYSSLLMFAGVRDYVATGTSDGMYGNGIVTADEISRLQLDGTELVVLSACVSGLSDITLSGGFRGMVGGFSAAGVRYVISSLWNVGDKATAVLMDKFYEYYVLGEAPYEALSHARDYVRNVTYAELCEQERYADLEIDGHGKASKPFAAEKYWAPFVCYQCNAV